MVRSDIAEVRLDIWLDVTCLARTRSQAKELCDGNKVEINGQRAKAHRTVRLGDHIRLSLGPGVRRELIVREVIDTHVAKARAREAFEDVTPPPTPDELEMRELRKCAPPPSPPKGAGRPEKRDRRASDRLRGR